MPNYVWESSTVFERGENTPMVLIFGRDVDTNEVKRFATQNFKPYSFEKNNNGKLLSCYGEPIQKVVFNNLKELREHRSMCKINKINTYEADIDLDYRYLIDKKISYGFNEKMEPVDIPVKLPRICYFDIEVNIPTGEGIDEEKSKHPIVAIGVMDSFTEEIKIFTYGFGKVADIQTDFSSEKELLVAFADYVHDLDPDILTGWCSKDFDMPYILNRAKLRFADISGLSRLRKIYPSEFKIAGRSHADSYELFKDWSKPMGQQPSYGLKYIARTFCDFAYEEQGAHIAELIEEKRFADIVSYLTNDIIALRKIDMRFGLFKYHESLRRIIGIKMDDVIKRTVIVETLLMRKGIKPIPTKKQFVKQELEGAYVHQPTPGLKRDVGCIDQKSLYPSIMIALNISPDIDKMIPKTIIYVLNEREKLRALRMSGNADDTIETSEQSLKYVANAFYGYLGSIYAKLYYPEGASLITKTGRDLAEELRAYLATLGYETIYGDTDSTFISPVRSPEEGLKIQELVNQYQLNWAKEHNVKPEYAPIVKFEKLYDKIIFKKKGNSDEAAKKNYAGHLVWKDGHGKDELSYTGLGIKRSDNAPISKWLMENFFKLVLIDGNVDEAVRIVSKAIKDVTTGDVNIHKIAIPKAIKSERESAWSKGRDNGEKYLGIRFQKSSKPKLLYCKTPVKEICIDDDSISDEVKKKITIDWVLMCDKTVTQKMKSLIESLGISWNTVILGQQTWDDFK